MKYRLHDGIVYTSVSNVFLLVATRSVWDQFPSVKTLSPLQGWFCAGFDQGMDTEDIIRQITQVSTVKEEAVRSRLNAFIEKMTQEQYIVPEKNSAE